MARIPRHYLLAQNALFHVTWQCHNKSWLLKPRWAKQLFYGLLLKYKPHYGMIFFSYTIMDNHIHLSGVAPNLELFSAFFRVVHSVFAKKINQRLNRCGQVIRDRFKSPCLQNETSLIQEMIYHDLNEVRAGKAKHPKENQFSSYKHYALGISDPLLTDPQFYIELGSSPKERQVAYQSMVLQTLVNAPRKIKGRYLFFVGDPLWVKQRYDELRFLQKSLNERLFLTTSPPI